VKIVGCWRTFNSEKWLGYSILSTLRHIDEVLVVDGSFAGEASMDATSEIADAFSATMPVHMHRNGPCRGWAGKNELCTGIAERIPGATHLLLVDHDEIVNCAARDTLKSFIASVGEPAIALCRRDFVRRLDRMVGEPVSPKIACLKLHEQIRCETRDGRGYNEHWVAANGDSLLDVGTHFIGDEAMWLDHLRNVEGDGRMFRDLWERFVRFEDGRWASANRDAEVARKLRAHILSHRFFAEGLRLIPGHVAPAAFRCKAKRPWQQHRLDVCSGAPSGEEPGRVSMDVRPLPGVDVVHDAAETPWPFPDETFDAVTVHHGLEHIHWERVPVFLAEALRVLRRNGSIHIVGPDPVAAVHQTECGMLPPSEAMRRVLGLVGEDYEGHSSMLFRGWVIDSLTRAGLAHASVLLPPNDWEVEFIAFKAPDAGLPREDEVAAWTCEER
jgi:SAM-dependent methyltransferase